MPVTFNKLEAVNRALVAAGKPALSIVVVKGERAAAENQPRVTTELLAKAAYIFVVPEMLDEYVSPGENGKALRSFVAHNKIGLAVLDEADLILDWPLVARFMRSLYAIRPRACTRFDRRRQLRYVCDFCCCRSRVCACVRVADDVDAHA